MVLGIEKIFGGHVTPPTGAKIDGYTPRLTVPGELSYGPANFAQFDGPLDHPERRTNTDGQRLYTLG